MAGAHEDVSKHVKVYMAVFIALIIGTITTVLVAWVHIAHPWNYVVGLLIASIKASLVAAIFMHLKWESGGVIWWVLGLTAVFFVVLMLLPVLTVQDHPPMYYHGSWSAAIDGGSGATVGH